MKTITSQIKIEGNAAAIFDLVTTTRFWTAWHPATTGVGGVTQRPFQLGDQIRERAQIGARVHEGTWAVVAHDRPHQATLRMESGRLFITYTFQPTTNGVALTRELTYHPTDFAASVADPVKLEMLMLTQSEQALQKLKTLVEQMLATEATFAIRVEP
uniref:Polyketide cyclase/dehydrase n=1 Tax=uncultured bacterium A1Q1_fos_485 TaxID=1256576 RepID=L7W075_9BACT|nr:hypothetical protein [uncultured bacterium A1Q1_fos_485]